MLITLSVPDGQHSPNRAGKHGLFDAMQRKFKLWSLVGLVAVDLLSFVAVLLFLIWFHSFFVFIYITWITISTGVGFILFQRSKQVAIQTLVKVKRRSMPSEDEVRQLVRNYNSYAWMLPGPISDGMALVLSIGFIERFTVRRWVRRLKDKLEGHIVEGTFVEVAEEQSGPQALPAPNESKLDDPE